MTDDTPAAFKLNPGDVLPYEVDELHAWPRDEIKQLDADRLLATSPLTVAGFLERMEVGERRTVLRMLSNEQAAEILSEMEEEDAADVVVEMREPRALEILEEFDPDDAADLIAEMEDDDRDRLLGKMTPDSAQTVTRLMAYDPETAGGIMTTEVDTARADLTVQAAIEQIRTFAEKHEDLHYVYVVDEERHLEGIISLRKLIQARPYQRIREVMKTEIKGVVQPETDREAVALLMAEYNLPDLAVVDAEGVLLGVITHDDVIDVIQEEAGEDLQIMHGAGADESIHDDISYSIRKRIPWLQVNLVTACLAAAVVIFFDDKIGQLPLLAAFMPVIAGIGGNSGQQALAVAIRSLAMGEIRDADTRQILFRQVFIGLFNGLAVGLIAGVFGWLVSGLPMFGMVVLIAMILNMTLGTLVGTLIPLLLKRVGLDPAQSSSIFLTAITDVAGFFIFLSLGAMILL